MAVCAFLSSWQESKKHKNMHIIYFVAFWSLWWHISCLWPHVFSKGALSYFLWNDSTQFNEADRFNFLYVSAPLLWWHIPPPLPPHTILLPNWQFGVGRVAMGLWSYNLTQGERRWKEVRGEQCQSGHFSKNLWRPKMQFPFRMYCACIHQSVSVIATVTPNNPSQIPQCQQRPPNKNDDELTLFFF